MLLMPLLFLVTVEKEQEIIGAMEGNEIAKVTLKLVFLTSVPRLNFLRMC